MDYWDSSALTKLKLAEPDSTVFRALAERSALIRTSSLGQFETLLTIRRHEADAAITNQTADALADELQIDIAAGALELVTEEFSLYSEFQHVVQTCFRPPNTLSIRTLDALHLAAALSVVETELVSNHIRQRAAQASGMQVVP
ncbi:MAG: hypothetical protein NT013_13860 [Planctomycetia bacterium]|nr:hypothetical protein [Planctomycetia bacterium]